MLDDFPEALDDAFAPITLRCAEHDVGTTRERQQTRHHHGIDVEKRQFAEYRFSRTDAFAEELTRVPPIGYLVAVPANRNLRQPRGAACAEEGRYIVEAHSTRAAERLPVLPRDCGAEIVYPNMRRHGTVNAARTMQS